MSEANTPKTPPNLATTRPAQLPPGLTFHPQIKLDKRRGLISRKNSLIASIPRACNSTKHVAICPTLGTSAGGVWPYALNRPPFKSRDIPNHQQGVSLSSGPEQLQKPNTRGCAAVKIRKFAKIWKRGRIPMSKTVVFVCVHNSGRSQMAEAFFKPNGAGQGTGPLRGTQPGDSVNRSRRSDARSRHRHQRQQA